jgi:hypothetical protein
MSCRTLRDARSFRCSSHIDTEESARNANRKRERKTHGLQKNGRSELKNKISNAMYLLKKPPRSA